MSVMMTMSAEERHNTMQKHKFWLCQLCDPVKLVLRGCHNWVATSATSTATNVMAMSAVFLRHMHEDDSQKPLLLSETFGATTLWSQTHPIIRGRLWTLLGVFLALWEIKACRRVVWKPLSRVETSKSCGDLWVVWKLPHMSVKTPLPHVCDVYVRHLLMITSWKAKFHFGF